MSQSTAVRTANFSCKNTYIENSAEVTLCGHFLNGMNPWVSCNLDDSTAQKLDDRPFPLFLLYRHICLVILEVALNYSFMPSFKFVRSSKKSNRPSNRVVHRVEKSEIVTDVRRMNVWTEGHLHPSYNIISEKLPKNIVQISSIQWLRYTHSLPYTQSIRITRLTSVMTKFFSNKKNSQKIWSWRMSNLVIRNNVEWDEAKCDAKFQQRHALESLKKGNKKNAHLLCWGISRFRFLIHRGKQEPSVWPRSGDASDPTRWTPLLRHKIRSHIRKKQHAENIFL